MTAFFAFMMVLFASQGIVIVTTVRGAPHWQTAGVFGRGIGYALAGICFITAIGLGVLTIRGLL